MENRICRTKIHLVPSRQTVPTRVSAVAQSIATNVGRKASTDPTSKLSTATIHQSPAVDLTRAIFPLATVTASAPLPTTEVLLTLFEIRGPVLARIWPHDVKATKNVRRNRFYLLIRSGWEICVTELAMRLFPSWMEKCVWNFWNRVDRLVRKEFPKFFGFPATGNEWVSLRNYLFNFCSVIAPKISINYPYSFMYSR